jgi:hypothetical protein
MPNCDIRTLSKPDDSDEGSKGTADNFQLQASFSVHFGIILKPRKHWQYKISFPMLFFNLLAMALCLGRVLIPTIASFIKKN